MKAAIVLQARLGSRRLPGKALARIGARSLLAHCLERLRLASAAPVILATTTLAEDDCLVHEAAAHGVPAFRGPSEDVLSRFVLAAEAAGVEAVVRATGDNPAVDIDAPGRVLDHLQSSGADHVFERGLPYGSAVEAVTVAALVRAARMATDPADREHVTLLIRRDRTAFFPIEVDGPPPLQHPDLRLTVDTMDDLSRMRLVSARMQDPEGEPALSEIIAAAATLATDARCA